ncbi:MAG TPA: Tim44 domain-containing protein [Thiomicrospira sp.]|jgi:predicted lipid-binding transport protein (Tim44 family)|nr:Tim44 domain-containing protein [Thiomicrospira sp.]
MKKIFIILLTLVTFSVFSQVADAKRFGGGKSFGYSKQVPPKQYNQKPAAKPSKETAEKSAGTAGAAGVAGGAGTVAAKSGASRWLGPLAGLAAGGLLAAMIFGDGFAGIQILDILIIGGIAFVLFKLFTRRRQQPSIAGHEHSSDKILQDDHQKREVYQQPAPKQQTSSGSIFGSALSEEAQSIEQLPSWFDEAGFITNAKSHFVAVQKAWDAADVSEIESYCSAELFSALSSEMATMQAGENHTEIDELNVELVDAAIDADYLVVSIRFSGFIIEEKGGVAHSFNEIWHIRRLAIGEGDWQISGIQQP